MFTWMDRVLRYSFLGLRIISKCVSECRSIRLAFSYCSVDCIMEPVMNQNQFPPSSGTNSLEHAVRSCPKKAVGECWGSSDGLDHANDQLEREYKEYGCRHYKRRCRIRAPCCNEIFDCRHCHYEAKNNIKIEKTKRHDIPRHQVNSVICSLCSTEQEVRQACINCGVCMGKYFCETCKLFDDDVSKKQYHCDGCGICRIGGRENFFHCDKCRCCYSVALQNSHSCVEGALHHDCPVCFEYLFESRNDVTVLPCGHTIHKNCFKEMQEHFQYACPICSKSVYDMSKVWEKFDLEIAATPMPEAFQNIMVGILCNDCGTKSTVQYHIVALKCPNCKSYNTRQTRG